MLLGGAAASTTCAPRRSQVVSGSSEGCLHAELSIGVGQVAWAFLGCPRRIDREDWALAALIDADPLLELQGYVIELGPILQDLVLVLALACRFEDA